MFYVLFVLCFCPIFNVVFLFLLKHKRTKLQIRCISHGQMAFSPAFDLNHNYDYILTSDFLSSQMVDFCF